MSEMQETYAVLTEIDRLLAGIELKINKIEGNTPTLERNLETFLQLERVALRYLAILNRLGLPEDAEAVISTLARLISMIRMAQITLNLFYAASGPIGWAAVAGGAIMTGLSGYGIYESLVGV